MVFFLLWSSKHLHDQRTCKFCSRSPLICFLVTGAAPGFAGVKRFIMEVLILTISLGLLGMTARIIAISKTRSQGLAQEPGWVCIPWQVCLGKLLFSPWVCSQSILSVFNGKLQNHIMVEEQTSSDHLVQHPWWNRFSGAACTQLCPGCFWIHPEKETPWLLWAACCSTHSPSQWGIFSSYLDGTWCVSVCALCSLPCHWAVLKRACAHPFEPSPYDISMHW